MTRILTVTLVLLVFLCGISLAGETGRRATHPLDSLEPGAWLEVEKSHMVEVVPKPSQYLGEPRDIMRAWNGAAFDTKRDRLVVWGGGHVNYGGNEVYVFDVEQMKWMRLTDPSPTTLKGGKLNESAGQINPKLNPDNTPISKHSYDGLEYLPPPVDRFFQHGGSRWFVGGEDKLTWLFDFDSRKWTRASDAPLSTLTAMSAYDPVTGLVYVQNASRLMAYNGQTNEWKVVGSTGSWSSGGVASIDPVRRHLVTIEQGRMYYYDLTGKPPFERRPYALKDDVKSPSCGEPGFDYSTKADVFTLWCGTTSEDAEKGLGNIVFILDPETRVWREARPKTQVAPPKGIKEFPHKNRGTYGRWRYIPSHDVFIGVNNIYKNVYFFKLPNL